MKTRRNTRSNPTRFDDRTQFPESQPWDWSETSKAYRSVLYRGASAIQAAMRDGLRMPLPVWSALQLADEEGLLISATHILGTGFWDVSVSTSEPGVPPSRDLSKTLVDLGAHEYATTPKWRLYEFRYNVDVRANPTPSAVSRVRRNPSPPSVPAGVDEVFFVNKPPAPMFREYVLQWLAGPAAEREVMPGWVVRAREGAQISYTPQSRGPTLFMTVGFTDPSERACGHDFVLHGESLHHRQPITASELLLTDAQLRRIGIANGMALREMWPRFQHLVLRQLAKEARRAPPR